jgi:hypothetical protein
MEGLLTLKRLGDSQNEIARYVEKQARLFDELVSDTKGGLLQAGTSRQEIQRTYGDPVFFKDTPEGSVSLYRHPTRYFDSERIYLYFDESEALTRWEYQPAQ